MIGDPGPYMGDDGDVWVPRTVPYLKAREIAKQADFEQYGQRLAYLGKVDEILLGFTRDCPCDEACSLKLMEAEWDQPEPPEGYDACRVPAWHFVIVER